MSGPKRILCKTCRQAITPQTLGHSPYSRRLPMCESCEEEALRVRPSPQDRQVKGYRQR